MYALVPVFYATDRNFRAGQIPAEQYGADRSSVTYGTCLVSIPKTHKVGELERPSVWKLEFCEDPKKHVVLQGVTALDSAAYFAQLQGRVRASKGKNAFVFVHGYNVSFADAALRTGQMSYDLDPDITPVFYSWPSQGHFPAYIVDEDNIEWSQLDLKNFLADFAEKSGAENIYLIAHSMGNRALSRAFVALLTEKPELKKRFKEIILAAPDMDAEVFKREIAPKFSGAKIPATLYASSQDRALKASQKLHGYARAGETGKGIIIAAGMDTIDASQVDSEDWLLGHSYFGSRCILGDLYDLIINHHRADQRFSIKKVESPQGVYYRFE
jgi:esterase/lipase superfamily enzyme